MYDMEVQVDVILWKINKNNERIQNKKSAELKPWVEN